MKKCIILVLLCAMVGCARVGDESAVLPDIVETGENRSVDTLETSDTVEVSGISAEPTAESIVETAGSSDRLPLRSDEIDLSQFNVITEYEIDDYIYMLADKWSAELKVFIGEYDDTIRFCRIGDHVLIDSSSSYEWGSWDKDYVVMSENSFSVLREIYSMGDVKLFIYDGRLYAYDYWWQNGFIHSFYTVYDLDNERMERPVRRVV